MNQRIVQMGMAVRFPLEQPLNKLHGVHPNEKNQVGSWQSSESSPKNKKKTML
jgi:hypothetical protein